MNNKMTIISGIMLFLAIFTFWPYGFYQLLRWVVCFTAVINSYQSYEIKMNSWVVIMIILAITFNPISPLSFTKETWIIIDLIGSTIMFSYYFKLKSFSKNE